ncbi:MAG: carboxypeptidase-like regulatory domain-containing protein [Sphingobacteriales bacterium]|nr:carboxypeptidase-like regulatory domain-containing protein [Sphingobacteriales bacterium]
MIQKLSILTLSLTIFLETFSQSRILRGKVVDELGQPVAYASITFKGFIYGTSADRNGNYVVTILEKYDSIVCTHTSYKRIAEKIAGNTTINFVMERMKLPATALSIDTAINAKSSVLIAAKENEEANGEEYFAKVEINASFPGGEKALQKYLKNKLSDSMPSTFPKVKGVVKYGFNISREGLPNKFILLKGIEESVDEYVMQILSKMPKWTPALQNGPTVEQYREVEIYLNIH